MTQINNPGGGDCGFYAFAIGLIATIQNEYEKNAESPTFLQWEGQGLDNVSLDLLLEVDLRELHQYPKTYKTELLYTLQMSLRNLTANAYKEDLLSKIHDELQSNEPLSKVECSPVYGKFMELVQAFLNKTPSRRSLKQMGQTNELALSPECNKLAEMTARSLQPKLKNQLFAQAQKIENMHVKNAFLKNIMNHNEINHDSIILKGIDVIKNKGRWASHSDLTEIADRLEINLIVQEMLNGTPTADRPTVTLNNINNVHWTTSVDLPEKTSKEKLTAKPDQSETIPTKKRTRSENPVNSQLNATDNEPKKKNKTQHTDNTLFNTATFEKPSLCKNLPVLTPLNQGFFAPPNPNSVRQAKTGCIRSGISYKQS